MPKHVVFSDRAITSILAETHEKIKTETGGVFLGHRKDDIWYVVENADPGIKATYTTSYFEYDQNYINHIINKLARLYIQPLELLGLWHRHPGSMDTFSSTDDGTNTEFAKLNSTGAISMLVNIDPKLRFTVYHVTMPLRYEKITYSFGDERIPSHLLTYKPRKHLLQIISYAGTNNSLDEKEISSLDISKSICNITKEDMLQTGEDALQKKFSFSSALSKNIILKSSKDKTISKATKGKDISDEGIDLILDTVFEDIEYLTSIGIECFVRNKIDYIELIENLPCSDIKPVVLHFYLDDENKMLCKFKNNIFEYLKERKMRNTLKV